MSANGMRFKKIDYPTEEARVRGERAYNVGIHANVARIRAALNAVSDNRIDVTLVDWQTVDKLLDAINDAADCLGGGDNS